MKDNLSRLESVMDEHQSVFLTLDRFVCFRYGEFAKR